MNTRQSDNSLGQDSNWQTAKASQIPCAVLNDWLLNTGSLTERLKSRCRNFRVEILQQCVTTISADEAKKLQLNTLQAVTREVLLYGDGEAWVYARTLMSPHLYTLEEKGLSGLGNQPLGSVIFNDPQFIRHAFELTSVQPDARCLQHLGLGFNQPLWGRRSVFNYQHHHMMVSEFFLPKSPAYSAYHWQTHQE